ncbi:hypothetical protein GH714_008885 [Hevea brasiliensis]|uniref:Protein kinase domain-containing protein n=1 Tax=Hevea brasiliensis TaxID=3981 RepID=A0A6A6LWT3_HEVBR|nr:hypothetical protein GH714_008885 [Hevea brasiliensis]
MVEQRIVVPFAFLLLLLKFQPAFQQVETLSSSVEQAALLELRSSLGIRSEEWPTKANPCLNWAGVACQNGSVSGINISGFRRTRLGSQNPQFSVDAIANLTHLTAFNASRFLLPGSIPDWFGQSLGSLQLLDLRFCAIKDAIPASTGNLTNITSLYLSEFAYGSIPPSFGSLGNLTVLDISSNFLSGSIPPGIGMLLKLQYLNLSSNQLSSSIPAQLGDLGKLIDLDVSLNSLSGSLPVNLLPAPSQLQIVVLKDNGFTGAVPDVLWTMPRLLLLDISGNKFAGFLPDSTLNANATTAELNLSGNLFYGDLKPILRRFRFVDLSGNYFEGRVPDYLPNNASLVSNCLQNVTSQRSFQECASFYAEMRLTFDNFGLPNSTQPPARDTQGKSSRRAIILAGVLGGVGLIIVLLTLLIVLLLICFHKRGTANQGAVGVEPLPAGSRPPPPEVSIKFSSLGDTFTHQQLLQATADFSDANLIKHGHSGDLYRGILENGISVVIKRVDMQSTKKEAYLLELDFFSKVSHPRLVPLLGHCLENENEKFLIYKYMPNGDLSSSFYRKTSSEDNSLQSLDWITRLKIAIGAAEGLSCLHHECTPPIVHRDVQASSILLDDKFEVRLGSLSEVCPQDGDIHQNRITRSSEQGTSGSVTATCAYDIYCFGRVLLELVTGKVGMSASSEAHLKEWLEQTLPCISIYDKELVTKIVDPSLIIDEDLLEEVWAMAIVARSCLNPKPSRRPLMHLPGTLGMLLYLVVGISSSDVAVIPTSSSTGPEGGGSFKHSGTSNSQGSGQNGGGEHSSSHRRQSREIFPEPSPDVQDVERLGMGGFGKVCINSLSKFCEDFVPSWRIRLDWENFVREWGANGSNGDHLFNSLF